MVVKRSCTGKAKIKLAVVLGLTVAVLLIPQCRVLALSTRAPQKAEILTETDGADAQTARKRTVQGKTADILRNHEGILADEEVTILQPADSFLYRYDEIIAEREAIAEQERLAEEERRRIVAEQRRLEAARRNVAKLTETQLDEIFSADYFSKRLVDAGFYKQDFSDASLNRRNAIIRLQSSVNHPINARMDLVSKKALVEEGAIQAVDTISNPPSDSYWIAINKSRNILTVYRGAQIYKKYPVATGKQAGLTPEGKFTFVSKAVNPAWGGAGISAPISGGAPNNPLGKRWMGLSIGGGGQYGVHGNASASSIGTYASLGCVRMINTDVVELYEYIPVGTHVWIGSDSKLREWGVRQDNSDPGEGSIPELEEEPETEPEPEPVPVDENKAVIMEFSEEKQTGGTTKA